MKNKCRDQQFLKIRGIKMCLDPCLAFFLSELVDTWSGATAICFSRTLILLFQIRFECTKENRSPSTSWVSAVSLPPRAPHQDLLPFLCRGSDTLAPESVGVITVGCRLLWCRLLALTGFGMGVEGEARGCLDNWWLGSVWDGLTGIILFSHSTMMI